MKTKTFFAILFATLIIFNVSAQNNKIVKRNINVSDFSAISASSGWDIIIRQGNRPSVSIEISENLLDRAVIEVKNDKLHLYNKNNNRNLSWKNIREMNNATQKAYVTVTDLSGISASGGVDIYFETPIKTNDFELEMSGGSDLEDLTLSCNNFSCDFSGGCDAEIRFSSAQNVKAEVSGGSDVYFSGINAQKCEISAGGGCDIDLKGKTKEFTVDASGGCDVSASNFIASNCVASFSGAADGEIHVTNRLNVSASGGSDVICLGNPKTVDKSIGKSSSLTFR